MCMVSVNVSVVFSVSDMFRVDGFEMWGRTTRIE